MKILVTDDLEENRYNHESLLTAYDYDVLKAKNGIEALKILKKYPVELIISNIMMPEMDGFQLCRKCKTDEKLKKIPFIFYTDSNTHKEDEEFGLSIGADKFMVKPVDPKDLINTINEMILKVEQNELEVSKVNLMDENSFLEGYNRHLIKKLQNRIDQLEKAKKKLADSKEKYRIISESVGDVVWILDINSWKFKYVSPSVYNLRGYTYKEVLSQSMDEVLTPECYQFVEKNLPLRINAFLNGDESARVQTHEILQTCKDGSIIPTEVVTTLVTDDNGKVKEIVGVSRDIKERREAENALIKSEKKLKALIHNSTDIIRILDKNGLITFDSSSSRILGYPEGSLIGKSPLEFIHPDDVGKVAKDLNDVYKEKNPGIPTEFRIRKFDGKYLPVESIAQNLIDNPEIEGIVLNTHPIKDRKKLENHLIRINRSLKTISDCNQILIRAKDEKELLQEICNVIIDNGDYKFTWVGYIDNNQKVLHPVALAGNEKFIENITIQLDNNEFGRYPCVNAYRNRKEFIINDINLENFAPWSNEALKRGYESVISLPLLSRGNIVGIISIYSSEKDRFDKEEIELLKELADDLAYGIISIRSDIKLKQLINELEESEHKYRAIFENTGTATIIIEEDKKISLVNSEFEKLYGSSKEEIEDKIKFIDFIGDDEDLRRIEGYHKVRSVSPHSVPRNYEFKFMNSKRELKDVYATVALIPGTNQRLISLLDITDKKQSRKALRKSLKEKELLLREVHHRVKNNLQIMSSLLNLQSNVIKDEKALEALRDSQTRVRSMALIHGELYQSENLVNIDFGDYIRNLVLGILSTYAPYSGIIHEINVNNVFFDIDTAIPCGLMINELVLNSIKHAFTYNDSKNENKINIELFKENSYFNLIVEDNGIGIPEDLDITKTDTLGLQLVNSLVSQLDGKIKLDRNNGTKYNILFKELKYNSRL